MSWREYATARQFIAEERTGAWARFVQKKDDEAFAAAGAALSTIESRKG